MEQNNLVRDVAALEEIVDLLKDVFEFAKSEKPEETLKYWNKLVMDYTIVGRYHGAIWVPVSGAIDSEFVEKSNEKYGTFNKNIGNFDEIVDNEGNHIDFVHMIAALQSYYYHGRPAEYNKGNVGDIGGWGGDLTSLAGAYYKSFGNGESIEGYMEKYCLVDGGNFGITDYISDIDAFNLFMMLNNDVTLEIYNVFKYYDGNFSSRYDLFFQDRVNGSDSTMLELATNLLLKENGPSVEGVQTNVAVDGIFAIESVVSALLTVEDAFISEDVIFKKELKKFAQLFVEKQLALKNK